MGLLSRIGKLTRHLPLLPTSPTAMKSVALPDLFAHAEPCLARFEGVEIPVHYKRGSNKTLIVLFHGAVDQKLRPRPFFQPHFTQTMGAHQLAISDPSLARSDELKAAWFLGDQDLPLATLLPAFFAAVTQAGGFERVIYFGASAGGHAALHYSNRHAGSLALAVNPQINLNNYLPAAIDAYRTHCWTGLAGNDELDERVQMDAGLLYGEGMGNSVCILNSSGDRFHLFKQTFPFVARIPPTAQNRFVLHCDYYGIKGHSGSIPPQACLPWLKAAVLAPNLYADSLLVKFAQVKAPAAPAPAAAAPAAAAAPVRTPAAPAPVGFSADDIRMADAIRQWQLSSAGPNA